MKLKDNVIKLIKPRPEAWLLLYWPIHTVIYMVYNQLVPSMNYHVIYSPLDDKIPFVEYFVVPYVMWFFYIAAVLIWFLFKSRRDYLRTSFMLITGMVVSMIICFVYPSMHELRPTTFERDNICVQLVRLLYESDNPAIIFPSMHVLISCLLAISCWMSESMKGKLVIKLAATILSVLISLATVFIKQHSILDVFFALALIVPIVVAEELLFRKTARGRSANGQ